jgi:hypothetical protein
MRNLKQSVSLSFTLHLGFALIFAVVLLSVLSKVSNYLFDFFVYPSSPFLC